MSGAADLAQKVWTEAELEALPEDGFIHEVVGGELVMSPKNDFFHGDICARLLTALEVFNQANKLGAALDSMRERRRGRFHEMVVRLRGRGVSVTDEAVAGQGFGKAWSAGSTGVTGAEGAVPPKAAVGCVI